MENFQESKNLIEEESANNEAYDCEEITEAITSGTMAQLQAITDFNINYATGTLGVIGCLGFVFGALIGSVYDRIFRK